MADSFNKKEKEKKKAQKRKEKAERKETRKSAEKSGRLEDMMAYVDENGQIVDTPPDETRKKKAILAEDIELGVPKREDLPEDKINEGKVAFFNADKGYGFIKHLVTQDSFFVHINNCSEVITEGDKVQFEIQKGDRGPTAVRVRKIR